MKNPKITSLVMPIVVAMILFLSLGIAYFAPQMQGKKIQMHDITQYAGMTQDILEHQQKFNEDPQWAGRMFSGMPAYLINVKYDSMIIKNLRPVFEFIGFPASLIFVAMAAFFFMLMMWGVNPWIGIIPSIAYGLSTYFFLIIGAGHITKMVALAYIPVLIGAVFYAYRKNMWVGGAIAALFGALEIMANHPQITYYFIMVLVAFCVNEFIRAYKQKTIAAFAKVTTVLALAGVLAVGANFASLWYVKQHTNDTMRGGSELTSKQTTQTAEQTKNAAKQTKGLSLDYATQWSYGRTESLNMIIPNLMGGESAGGFKRDGEVAGSLGKYNARSIASQLPAYWGDQPMTGGPTYIGAVIIFIAVLGLFILSGYVKWWIVIVSVMAILLSWGYNMMWFTELFFNYLPGYNKFRTVSMILVIIQWSVPFIAALALNKLWNGDISREQTIKALKKAIYIVGGITLFFVILGGAIFTFSSPADATMGLPDDVIAAMQIERAKMLREDAIRSLIFVALTAGVIWMFVVAKMKKWMLAATLALLVVADLVPVNLRYLPQSKFVEPKNTEIKPSKANVQIMEDKTPGYRVANLSVSTFNDASTSYFHRSVGGYHGAKLQRYQDVIDRYLSKMDIEIYNMLNAKYFIVPSQNAEEEPVVQLNPDANGAAWFVNQIVIADSPDQEIEELAKIDNKTVAVVDKKFEKELEAVALSGLPKDSATVINIVEYRVNYQKYHYIAPQKGVAVFSEVFYDKGWTAFVDGVEAPYFRADYILRAMVLPEGEHSVEFRFRAPNFATIENITLICSFVIILWLITVIAISIKKSYSAGK